jgi:hypothetical protein
VNVIRRYTLAQSLELPVGADLLKIAMMGADMVLWCQVESKPTVEMEVRHFAMYIDGERFEQDMVIEYLGSAVDGAGQWRHVFEVEAPLGA